MSELCAICRGYESDGEDYIRVKCSECQEEDCTCADCECADCADCADWLSEDSESEGESTGDVAPQSLVGYDPDSKGSSSESDQSNEAGTNDIGTNDNFGTNVNAGTKELLEEMEREKAEKEEASKNEVKEDPHSSSDEEKYPADLLQAELKRTKRYTSRYGRCGYGRRHHGRSRRRRSAHHRMRFTKIQMPSRKIATITAPQANARGFKCGDKTKLITLQPHGHYTMSRVEYSLIADEMEKTRRTHGGGQRYSGYNIISIQKIVNPCLWKRYRHRRREILNETKYTNEKLLFHGSPKYKDLIETGMDERYSGLQTNMFGAGLYFARHSSKSNQYSLASVLNGGGCTAHNDKYCMICERALLLCRVLLGNTMVYTTAQHLPHPPANYHSVKGEATPSGTLNFDEYVVYKGDQVYPEYLIMYTLKP